MSASEQKAQLRDIAQTYIDIAEKYGHSAIFVRADVSEDGMTRGVLEQIRAISGDRFFSCVRIRAIQSPVIQVLKLGAG